MKRIIYLVAIAIAFSSCQKQAKIGFVDNGTVINDYQEKKDVETKYEEKETAFRKRADSIGQAFQLEAQEKQALAQRSSQAKAQQIMEPIYKKQQQLQQQMQMEQQMMQKEFQADIDSVINHVKAFVKDYGKKNGYTYILGTSEAAATVMYGTDDNDLTKTITDALNEAYKK
ncbi:OmpH family outer membrane protein [Aestuariibaculum sediminum]|uniref:OmpH family outer membrane protein n=1 Tax=Aestuariibaculum sediminum TaxID=2770637 RepID=A0A8J6UBR3_9FLAO|nr:OmpH family outer membrane protein [Aestuariibaculum sediminum]MBD0831239.1 OmpH family outer membrane protein [Aestuariibaculum sediminum]